MLVNLQPHYYNMPVHVTTTTTQSLSNKTFVGPTRFNSDVTIFGNLSCSGTQTFNNTIFSTTSAVSVVHVGSGPALWVGNNGIGDIASFYDIDQNVEVFHIGGNNGTFPNVGVKTSSPNVDFTVNGAISASSIIYSASSFNVSRAGFASSLSNSTLSFTNTAYSTQTNTFNINGFSYAGGNNPTFTNRTISLTPAAITVTNIGTGYSSFISNDSVQVSDSTRVCSIGALGLSFTDNGIPNSINLSQNPGQPQSNLQVYLPSVDGTLITDTFAWGNGQTIGWSDAVFVRDAGADIIAMRRSTNAQTFRVYNTYTSFTNYERGFNRWSSNVFQIGTEKGSGGGSARSLGFVTDGVERINIGAAGGVSITGSISATGPTLTGSQATNTLSVSANWNTTGNPALIYGRVANTASGATANLIDVGTTAGGTLFRVGKDGGIILGGVQQVITSPSTYSKLIAANWLFANAANPGSQYFYAEPGQITISQANGSLATTLNSAAAATLQLGINAASGVNQTIKACNGTAGAGANLILVGGTGTTTNGGVVVGTNGTASVLIRHGSATLVAGTVTVADTNIVAGSRIFVNRQTDGGTIGDSYSITRIAGTSFTVTSKTANTTATLDTSTVSYLIINP